MKWSPELKDLAAEWWKERGTPRSCEIAQQLQAKIGDMWKVLIDDCKPQQRRTNAKANGKFETRRISFAPTYLIDENGHVLGPQGTELKYRWNLKKWGVPYVSIHGKDKSVYQLLIDAGFVEDPNDRRRRNGYDRRPKDVYGNPIDWRGKFNSLEEAQAEDPELYGYPDGRDL